MPVQDQVFDDLPVDLREMIAKPIGEWEAKPLLPLCHLFGECIDLVTGKSSNKGTRYFAFICQPNEFGPDVTPEMQKLLNGVSLTDYEFPRRDRCGGVLPAGQIWIATGAMSMNREFFTSMGFPEAKPMDECISEMRGKKVLMQIGRDSYKRDEGTANERIVEFNVMTALSQDPR